MYMPSCCPYHNMTSEEMDWYAGARTSLKRGLNSALEFHHPSSFHFLSPRNSLFTTCRYFASLFVPRPVRHFFRPCVRSENVPTSIMQLGQKRRETTTTTKTTRCVCVLPIRGAGRYPPASRHPRARTIT